MPSHTDAAQRLLGRLDLLDRVGAIGGTRELTALALRMDGWVDFASEIVLPDGTRFPEAGFSLPHAAPDRVWLLPQGRVLRLRGDRPPAGASGETPDIVPLTDADLDPAELAACLRPPVIAHYLGGLEIAGLTGPTVPVVVADLLHVAQQAVPSGRAAILDMLADAMHDEAGWNQAAARLKAGFEHGLGDRAEVGRAAAARGLVRLAAGLGPVAGGNPLRSLEVLFAVPRADVHVAALRAVAALPPDAFARVSATLAPLVRAAMVATDAEERRLAAEMALRIEGADDDRGLAADLDAGGDRRRDALRKLAGGAAAAPSALVPRVLDAAHDADAGIRDAALGVLQARLAHESAESLRRIVLTLLASPDPRLVQWGLATLHDHLDGAADPARPALDPRADARLKQAVFDALDGPEDSRAHAARLWLAMHVDAPAETTAETTAALLRHADPVVRLTGLRHLAAVAPSDVRAQVRDLLLKPLVERLRDPEPGVRVEAMRAVLGQRYPQAVAVIGQLALDPDPVVRQGVLHTLAAAGDDAALQRAERTIRHVRTLLAPPDGLDEPGWQRWFGALEAVAGHTSSWVNDLLVAVLAEAPERPADPYWVRAIEAIDKHVLEHVTEVDDLLSVCHRLLELPQPRPGHATRLAGRVAAASPRAVDFLWALCLQAEGAASAMAREALGALAMVAKTVAVEDELHVLAVQAEDAAQRDFLRRIMRQPPGGPLR